MDIGILEVLLLFEPDMRTNAVDNCVLISDDMFQISLVSEVVQLNVCFVSKISCDLDLLELPVPDCSLSSIRIDNS